VFVRFLFGLVKFLLHELGQALLHRLAFGERELVLLVFWDRCPSRFFGCVFWARWFGALGEVQAVVSFFLGSFLSRGFVVVDSKQDPPVV
jgi:hypothetical protein